MIFIKQNDRRPVANAVIKHGTTIVDLTLATSVTFKMTLQGRMTPTVDGAGVVTAPTLGAVEYEWAAGDTDNPGTYFAEWEVLWNDGTTETFPTVDWDIVVIRPDLDGS